MADKNTLAVMTFDDDTVRKDITISEVMGFLEDNLAYIGFGRNNISEVDPLGDGSFRIRDLCGVPWRIWAVPRIVHVYGLKYKLKTIVTLRNEDTGEEHEWWIH